MLKEASRTGLVRAIRTVARGGRYLDPAIGGWALTSGDDVALTEQLPDTGGFRIQMGVRTRR